jgi:FixJ family two-component response regulator
MASPESVMVAVVDDEPAVRKALVRLFRSAGHQARAFATGQEFLGALPTARFDCLVLDLGMAGMSGHEVQLALEAGQVRLPTVIITAHHEPGTRQKSLDAGAYAYLCKPFDDNELLRLVIEAIDASGAGNPGASTKGP